jgi:hypothetical protein
LRRSRRHISDEGTAAAACQFLFRR